MRRGFLSGFRSRYLPAVPAVPAVGIGTAPKESSARTSVRASLIGTFLLALATICTLLVVGTSATASAATTCTKALLESKLECQFGGEGQGAGQFGQPSGVAVDQEDGDVYVVDQANDR